MNRVNKKVKNKKNRKNRKFHLGRFILLLIFIIILFFGVNLGIKVYENGGGVQGFLSALLGQTPETLEDLDTIYVLVMGISEDLESKLTDTIILCAYNPKQQTASMLSIPRDTFVGKSKSNAKGADKINYLYSKGPQKTLEAVSELTGIDVKYYAVINNDALIKTVDIIGGVDFEVPINMDYDDKTQNLHIHLKKGMQKIDGEKAEQLLRFRHSNPDKNGTMTTYPAEYGNDDYGRMRTQREFIIATAKQTLQLKNITKVKNLMTTVFDNIDTNLTLDMLLPYAPYAVNFDTSTIESEQLPGVSDKYNDIWFFIHDKEETAELVEKMENKLKGIEPVNEDTNTIENENVTNTMKSTSNTSTKNTNTSNQNSKKSTNTSNKNTTKSTNTVTKNTNTTSKSTSKTNNTKK